jgi:formiminotetrahydrofolate cyclodeaminase
LNHPESHSLLNVTVGDLLASLGSSDPAPGGGAAAALAGALGAAVIEMTANLTLGRPRYAAVADDAQRIAARAAALRQALTDLGDADAAAFEQVGAAYQLPRADDAQKATRAAAIQAALRAAAEVPLSTASTCAEVIRLAEEAAPILNAAVISDVLVGGVLAQAALESAGLNVEVNLASMTDDAVAAELSGRLDAARAGAAERVATVLETGRSRFARPARPG